MNDSTSRADALSHSAILPGSSERSKYGRWPDTNRFVIGVLPGEGVGSELISVVRDLLHVVARHWQLDFEFRTGSAIGTEAEKDHGVALTQEVIDFCESLFADGGALLCGPGGSRFVYDLRARFDLFCKITPIQPIAALQDTGVLKPAAVESVDMLVVRENVGGLYFDQGQLSEDGATHSFRYSNKDVQRILEVAIRLAQLRRGRLALAVKPGAVKAVSQLWMDAFEGLTSGQGLSTTVLEIDNAAYQIIAAAPEFDVVVAPNMFGDILSDGAALLLSSRGLSFSGNFASSGAAVYQTGHGADQECDFHVARELWSPRAGCRHRGSRGADGC